MPDDRYSPLRLLGQLLAEQGKAAPAATYYPPPPPPGYQVPGNISVENRGPGRPMFAGGVNLGDMAVTGSYQKRDAVQPADWSALIRYNRQF